MIINSFVTVTGITSNTLPT